MYATVTLDPELVRTAQELTGIEDKSALVQEALKTLVQITASRRLAMFRDTMPQLNDMPRRKMN